ncbi:purine-nucleoside phosphorylase [Parasphaerochaeta coccoides]|uniref:Purine nucleoside phosphorylase n=1 Tax=Parasphaerochaeta coccoides (strain ATCC BAA-1237 / DSM 17374 / SPN1) TaxID=760011 RepID=F4GJ13_PARC1|nr:purine-nucleoside phosphorylase [Parasphaerochaeta coccoides]AEC01308.1 inosine guanosine and xanthosine phosphorylase family [Parasphaerochaeta coccoides DSM 17374]
MEDLKKKMNESSAYIRGIIGDMPVEIGIILGSGLGALADEVTDATVILYKDIPHFPVSTVPGHAGRLVIGSLRGRKVVCMQGRFHYYEGYGMDLVVFPVQVMYALGVRNLLLTNAAGCVNPAWEPGSLMIISDHIKLVQDNPLRGRNDESLGPRFFDMSRAYDIQLRKLARRCAQDLGIDIREGVYQLFTGPSFETPAEVRMARLLGADAVGMSTVPEAIAASHLGIRTLGISCLTNMASGILDQPLNHEEVLETGEKVKETFSALVRDIVQKWPL